MIFKTPFKYIITLLILLSSVILFGQGQRKKVLFLGNSYTGAHNLPLMVANMATSAGDTLDYKMNSPGGHTLEGHASNPVSLARIAEGNWDYVVLQEQSQRPSFPDNFVEIKVYPYAHFLDSVIKAHNPCSETLFYMTWGYKNGDPSNCSWIPEVCTYRGMDSLIYLRYMKMTIDNQSIVSPVGAVRRYIRENFPAIQLYNGDNSHPTIAGTYTAACTFYAAIFRKDPSLISFDSYLPPVDAASIRSAAKQIVFDRLFDWYIGSYDPSANFEVVIASRDSITFNNQSQYSTSYYWDFGDGVFSAEINPKHIYNTAGTFIAKLISSRCNKQDTMFKTIIIPPVVIPPGGNLSEGWYVYPNPATSLIIIHQQLTGKLEYHIYDGKGAIVKAGFIFNSDTYVNITDLPAGVFVLKLFSGKEPAGIKRFIKIPM